MPAPDKQSNPNGFHARYNITKVDGTPVDPDAAYFVLRVDRGGSDQMHISACREALRRYIECLRAYNHLLQLADDLERLLESTTAHVRVDGSEVVVELDSSAVEHIWVHGPVTRGDRLQLRTGVMQNYWVRADSPSHTIRSMDGRQGQVVALSSVPDGMMRYVVVRVQWGEPETPDPAVEAVRWSWRTVCEWLVGPFVLVVFILVAF